MSFRKASNKFQNWISNLSKSRCAFIFYRFSHSVFFFRLQFLVNRFGGGYLVDVSQSMGGCSNSLPSGSSWRGAPAGPWCLAPGSGNRCRWDRLDGQTEQIKRRRKKKSNRKTFRQNFHNLIKIIILCFCLWWQQ